MVIAAARWCKVVCHDSNCVTARDAVSIATQNKLCACYPDACNETNGKQRTCCCSPTADLKGDQMVTKLTPSVMDGEGSIKTLKCTVAQPELWGEAGNSRARKMHA